MICIGFGIELIFGLVYAWSVFVLPLETEFGWTRAQTSWAFTVLFIFFPVGMVAGGRLSERHSLRVTGSIATLLIAAGLFLASYTGSVSWLVVSFGAIAGFGIGMGSNTAALLLNWFDKRRGLAAGVLSMGFGLGGLLLGSLAGSAIAVMGWRAAFRLLAGVAFVVCFGGFQFLRKPPAAHARQSPGQPQIDDYTPAQMLRSTTFWLVFAWSLLVSTAGVMVFGHVVPLGVELGVAQAAAVLAMGVLSLANGLGRLVYGVLSDRLGLAPSMFGGALLMGAAILLAIPLTRSLGPAGLIAAGILIGSSYGGMVPLVTTSMLQLFGGKHFGTNLGIGSAQIAISAILGPQMAGFLRSSTGAYNLPFAITGMLALGACALAVILGLRLRATTVAATHSV
jgi:OFA family oxalate/formate antiporter-like MFS transporter